MARKQAARKIEKGLLPTPDGRLEDAVDEEQLGVPETDDDEVADSELGRAEEPETRESPLPVDEDVQQLERRGEKSFDEEDDFADGRSSSGFNTRADEDDWGRGTEPVERPFEESDVPTRDEEEPT